MEKNKSPQSPLATDIELAHFLGKHIINPCSIGEHNIRSFYIKEAKRVIPSMSDTNAKKYLEDLIGIYS